MHHIEAGGQQAATQQDTQHIYMVSMHWHGHEGEVSNKDDMVKKGVV